MEYYDSSLHTSIITTGEIFLTYELSFNKKEKETKFERCCGYESRNGSVDHVIDHFQPMRAANSDYTRCSIPKARQNIQSYDEMPRIISAIRIGGNWSIQSYITPHSDEINKLLLCIGYVFNPMGGCNNYLLCFIIHMMYQMLPCVIICLVKNSKLLMPEAGTKLHQDRCFRTPQNIGLFCSEVLESSSLLIVLIEIEI